MEEWDQTSLMYEYYSSNFGQDQLEQTLYKWTKSCTVCKYVLVYVLLGGTQTKRAQTSTTLKRNT